MISSLIYAHRFEYDDQRLAKILDLLEDLLKEESGLVPMVRGSGNSPGPLLCNKDSEEG